MIEHLTNTQILILKALITFKNPLTIVILKFLKEQVFYYQYDGISDSKILMFHKSGNICDFSYNIHKSLVKFITITGQKSPSTYLRPQSSPTFSLVIMNKSRRVAMKKLITLLLGTLALIFASSVFAADETDLQALADNADISACANDLITAYGSLGSVGDAEKEAVSAYYMNDFAATYGESNEGADPGVDAVLANLDDKGFYLQHYYLAANPEGLGAKEVLDQAEDGSDWSAAHGACHPTLRTELETRDLYDIFVVNDSGDIVYTVYKETDLGTNLASGSFSDSGLAQAYQAASDGLAISDVAPYWPSYEADAQFVCAPTGDGTICLQITPDQLAESGDIRE